MKKITALLGRKRDTKCLRISDYGPVIACVTYPTYGLMNWISGVLVLADWERAMRAGLI